MRKSSWIGICLVFLLGGLILGLYLGDIYGPNHIVVQAQANTKVNLEPKIGDIIEWEDVRGNPLPVKFSQGSDFFPCEEQEDKQNGNPTCTLKRPPTTMSFTYNCTGCFDPTLGPVSPKSPGGKSVGGSLVKQVDSIFFKPGLPPPIGGGGGMSPTGSEPPLSSGLPIDASVSCDVNKNVIVFQAGVQVNTITVNPGNLLQLTGFSDLKPAPPNPVASGQPLCSKGDLNPADACAIGSIGSYSLTISAPECTGASWAHSVSVVAQ
jgi:hypothetical protein